MTVNRVPDGLRADFSKSTGVPAPVRKRKEVAKPFSIRLSEDERKQLLREAGKLSLASHIRNKLS